MGKRSKTKGSRVELMITKMFRSWGLKAEKVPLSGATPYARGDVDVYPKGKDSPFIGEVKARANGFKTLHSWLEKDGADYLALKTDHKDVLFVVPERVMRELLCQ